VVNLVGLDRGSRCVVSKRVDSEKTNVIQNTAGRVKVAEARDSTLQKMADRI
jgi:hypothetical protein